MDNADQSRDPKLQRSIAGIILTVVVILGVIAAIVIYSSSQTALLYTIAENSAEKTAELGAREISATVEYGKSSIRSAANALAASMTSDTLEDPSASISPLLENTPFNAIEYIRADGMNVMNVGAPFDASNRTYYIEGIKGNTGIWNNYHPKTTQDVLMNFYTPLVRNGQTIGVITGYIEGNSTLAPTMEADFFGEKTYGLLFDSDNMVIAYTSAKDFQADLTLDAYLSTYDVTDDQKQQLLKILTSGNGGVAQFDGPDGEGLVCIAKVEDTDWTMATFIPATSINAVMKASRMQTMALVVVLILLALVMLMVVFLRAQRERKVLASENAVLDRMVSERTAELQQLNDEQEAHIEEITTLNGELEERQAQLEEVSAEQEVQIEEIRSLNEEIETSRDGMLEAYGMIEGLSQEYHTIWVVSKETSKMRLVRSSGKSTIQGAVQMGLDMPEFDAGFDAYIETYVEPEDRERMHREIAFAEVLRQLDERPRETYRVTYLRRTDDGQVGYHQIAFANADTKDGHRRFVYGFRDVDAIVREEHTKQEELRRARDAANAANEAKTSFLFSMSHDIRTPMNAIVGYTNLLKKDPDSEKRTSYLGKISTSSDFLLSLINNVLEMARIDSGKMALDETVCSIQDINDSLFSVFEGEMAKKGITYTRSIDVEHRYVLCDAVKLREVFLNLLSNALKYTPTGGSVNIELRELPSRLEGYALYQTKVSDTGIGMSADYLPHLFEEFSRERTSTESRVQGTGLGMPIVKKLVDLMGGTIDVESKIGRGTTFTISLHHRISNEEALLKVKAQSDVQVDLAGKRILLAEDNDLNAEIAIEILKETGAEIDRAEDGVVCVDMLEKAPDGYYDLILMDVQMPNMDGYKATRVIRHIPDSMKASIPIIAMTANAFEEDRRAALEAGMNAHVAKPIDVPKLMGTIAIALNGATGALPFDEDVAKGGSDEHENKVLMKLQQSFASMVVPGGFFAYWAEQPEKLIYANETACKIWGCENYQELYEFAGGSFMGLVHPDDYERVEQEIWACINSSEEGLDQTKYRIVKKDGTVGRVDDYGRLVRDPEHGDIFYVFVSEVSGAASVGE